MVSVPEKPFAFMWSLTCRWENMKKKKKKKKELRIMIVTSASPCNGISLFLPRDAYLLFKALLFFLYVSRETLSYLFQTDLLKYW